jgi:hypothetical protein
VAGIGVRVGVRVGVLEGERVKVGDEVRVEVSVVVEVKVRVSSGVPVAVANRSAKAAMVIARSVLWVAVAEPSPVFGMTRSELYSFCAVALVTMNGRLKATIHTSSRIRTTEISIRFKDAVPFLPEPRTWSRWRPVLPG